MSALTPKDVRRFPAVGVAFADAPSTSRLHVAQRSADGGPSRAEKVHALIEGEPPGFVRGVLGTPWRPVASWRADALPSGAFSMLLLAADPWGSDGQRGALVWDDAVVESRFDVVEGEKRALPTIPVKRGVVLTLWATSDVGGNVQVLPGDGASKAAAVAAEKAAAAPSTVDKVLGAGTSAVGSLATAYAVVGVVAAIAVVVGAYFYLSRHPL